MHFRHRISPHRPIFVAALLVAGCAHHPTSLTIPRELSKPDNELAILRIAPEQGSFLHRGLRFSGLIDYVKSTDLTLLRNFDFTDCTEIKVAPSVYEVSFSATGARGHAYPKIKLEVNAGRTYYFKTVEVMDGKAIRVEYRVEASTSNSDEKAASAGNK